jgi:predicted RNA binding protein YcfA (HicA-like mRNA interferase family)
MSTHLKTLQRLKATPTPNDISWREITTLLKHLGYMEIQNDGSRRKFVFPGTKNVIFLHKPHPQSVMKIYALKQLLEQLQLHARI